MTLPDPVIPFNALTSYRARNVINAAFRDIQAELSAIKSRVSALEASWDDRPHEPTGFEDHSNEALVSIAINATHSDTASRALTRELLYRIDK